MTTEVKKSGWWTLRTLLNGKFLCDAGRYLDYPSAAAFSRNLGPAAGVVYHPVEIFRVDTEDTHDPVQQ